MPARRDILRTLAGALPTGLAGCSALADGPPDHADWLYAPNRLAPADRHAFASFDLATLRERDTPDSLDETINVLDDEVPAVRLNRGERLLAQVAGDLSQGHAAATAVAIGSFSREHVRQKLNVGHDGGYRHVGDHGRFELYAFAPAFLAGLERYQPPDGPAPDLTLAVGVSRNAIVAGAVLARDQTGIEAVRTALAAQAGTAERLIDARRHARDLLAVIGREPIAGGVPGPVLDALGSRAEGSLKEVLTAADALGIGLRPAEGVADWALAGVSDAIDSATIRRAAEETGGDGVGVQGVTLRQDGRVVLVRTDINIDKLTKQLESLPRLLRDAVLNTPEDNQDARQVG